MSVAVGQCKIANKILMVFNFEKEISVDANDTRALRNIFYVVATLG